MSSSLAMTASTHRQLQQHLFPGDGLEGAAILLCHHTAARQGFRLTVSELICIAHQQCDERTPTRVTWPFTDYMPADLIERIDRQGLCIFTVHNHPKGANRFSSIDDDNDRALFASVCNWFDDGRPNGAAIMMPGGTMRARTCDGKGNFADIDTVSVVGDDIRIWKQRKSGGKKLAAAQRIGQTFGKGTLKLLRQLQVGVVGCSGTGSVAVELLARNCIGKLVLVDPDLVEEKNLNRIVNARMDDAANGRDKVSVLKEAVESMGTGTAVEAYCADTYGDGVLEALSECDVLFGCVDSVTGRYHLDCLASACLIPYFDVGVYLEAGPNGKVLYADAVAHYVHPASASLMERGVYTSEELRAEDLKRVDEASYEKQLKEGYLQGVEEDQPAVISVNMQAANMAVNDLLARLHGFRQDENADFAIQRMSLVQGWYGNESAPAAVAGSPFQKYMGMGDRSLMVRNIKSARHQ